MRARKPAMATPALLALALAVAALAAWRGACVLAGPDIDTDAYAHHMIARAILADPRDLSVHWVWLPLFHYLQVPLVALGATMEPVRWANVALAAALPIVLFAYVRRTSRTMPTVTALLAALFAAACPIAMQMGTTAQSEPLFALVMLGVAIAYRSGRYGGAAGLLAAAVMLRYEAWASLAAIAVAAAFEPWLRRRRGVAPEPLAWRAWVVVAAPVAVILAWAVLRRPVDGRWFGFLGDTHQFAAEATQRSGASRGAVGLLGDLVYYPLWIPLRVMGPVLPIVPFGIARTLHEQGGRFVLVLVACLGFVSLTWIMRSSLGLDRHFVAVVALYATFAAQGVVAIADGVTRFSRRIGRERRSVLAGRAVAGVLGVASLGGLCIALDVWMGFWKGSIERGWPERAALGAFLRSLPDTSTIFCDEATIEIPSGLDRRRFDRHWIDDPHTWELVADVARTRGVAYVATWSRKLRGHEQAGEVLFRTESEGDPSSGLAAMRVTTDAGRAAR